jgi:hypothetical protein
VGLPFVLKNPIPPRVGCGVCVESFPVIQGVSFRSVAAFIALRDWACPVAGLLSFHAGAIVVVGWILILAQAN